MRINTNTNAINAANNLSRVQSAVSDSMSKLSSGFRINKAADDAAGLGIANKLRADGRALTQASRNAEQTNSLLQVAEGATSTIQTVLERMKELATQSGSDTVDAPGRARINAEFTALRSEIDRTVSTTKFQGNSLLDGTFGTAAAQLATTDIGTVGTTASTALAGAYTVAVSNTGIATLNRPAGAVPPTYSIDLNAPTAGQVSFSAGKATLHFGTVGANDEVSVAGAATGAGDIAGIQMSLDQHGFTLSAAVATASSTATSTVAGATGIVVPAGAATGTLHFSTADASFAANTGLTSNTRINTVSVGATQVAGSYVVNVSAQSAVTASDNVSSQLGAGSTAVAVNTNAIAGTYTVKENGANTLQIFRTASDNTQVQVGADVDISGYTGGSTLAVSQGGVSFTIGTAANKAAFDATINGNTGRTFNVTGSAALTVTLGGVQQGGSVNLSGFDSKADVSVALGGINFNIDKGIGANSAAILSASSTARTPYSPRRTWRRRTAQARTSRSTTAAIRSRSPAATEPRTAGRTSRPR
jgi:flagellin